MLFDSRKKKRAQEILEKDRLLIERQFSADIQKAAQIEDPAKKIVALQYILNDIDVQRLKEDKDILNQAAQSGKKTSKRVGWGTVAGGLTALVLVAHPVGWGVLLGGAAAGWAGTYAASSAREKAVDKKLTKENATHTDRLWDLQYTVADMIRETVKNNAEVLKDYPLYDEVKKKYSITEEFLASAQPPAPANKVAPEAKEVKKEVAPKPARQPADFTRIKGALNRQPRQPK